MNDLVINATKATPAVNFSTGGRLEIVGQSYPENAFSFFEPLIKWVEEYVKSGGPKTALVVRLSYFNTSSSKCLLDLMEILNAAHGARQTDEIHWIYEKGDEDMKESGEEFAEDMHLPFKLIVE